MLVRRAHEASQGSRTEPTSNSLSTSKLPTRTGSYLTTFADYLNLTIDEGTGGSFGNCTGFTLGNPLKRPVRLSNLTRDHG